MWNTIVYIFTFQWLFPKKVETTQEQVERLIATESKALEETERALERSGEHVRKKNGKVTLLEQDVQQLTTRARNELTAKDKEAATKTMKDLIAKEKELAEAKQDAAAARKAHGKLEQEKEDHRREIREAKEDLEDLKVRGSTADARKRSTDRDSLKDVTQGMKTEVRQKENRADLDAELRQNPDDQFLDAAGNTTVEERLAQLEREK